MFLLWVSVKLVHPRRHHADGGVHLTAVSLDEDVDTDKELVGHGISNLAAGLFGTVYVPTHYTLAVRANTPKSPNYLVYVNTLLSVISLPALPCVY